MDNENSNILYSKDNLLKHAEKIGFVKYYEC